MDKILFNGEFGLTDAVIDGRKTMTRREVNQGLIENKENNSYNRLITMKSFTDLTQSEQLAEILPLDSADMVYSPLGNDHPWVWSEDVKLLEKNATPCWSVAALLDIMPLEVSFAKQTDGVGTYYYIASDDTRYGDVHTQRHLNVVDACVEMIVKLHELYLL
jgi:hypothetical protein